MFLHCPVSFEEFVNEDGELDIFEDNEETSDLFQIIDEELQGQTTLFEDSDQDGQINDTERAFPVATADEEEVASGSVGVGHDDDCPVVLAVVGLGPHLHRRTLQFLGFGHSGHRNDDADAKVFVL